jgi:hypothetical protein
MEKFRSGLSLRITCTFEAFSNNGHCLGNVAPHSSRRYGQALGDFLMGEAPKPAEQQGVAFARIKLCNICLDDREQLGVLELGFGCHRARACEKLTHLANLGR